MTPEQWEEIKPWAWGFAVRMLIGCVLILGVGE